MAYASALRSSVADVVRKHRAEEALRVNEGKATL
jgi:hypothetical protein